MTDAAFELLQRHGLTPSKAGTAAVASLSIAQLTDLACQLETVLNSTPQSSVSNFEFIANGPLIGAPYPCRSFECRLKNVASLIQFAALYAETVYAPNLFREFLLIAPEDDPNGFKAEFIFTLAVLYRIRPLLASGLIRFVPTAHYNLCIDCYGNVLNRNLGASAKNLLRSYNSLKKHLTRRYRDEVTHTFRAEAYPHIRSEGPEDLLDHGVSIYIPDEWPAWLKARFDKGPFQLTKKQVVDLDLGTWNVSCVMNDVLRQNYYSNLCNTSYLTSRPVDFAAIRALTKRKSVSSITPEIFSHEVPILDGVKIESLVKLRRDEAEAFSVYRAALTKAVHSSKSESSNKVMKQIFNDVVKPELNRLDATFKNARRVLRRELATDAIAATAFVGLGLFSGILPENIGQIVAAMGGFHYTQRISNKVSKFLAEPPQLRNSKFYFLWKTRRLLTKH